MIREDIQMSSLLTTGEMIDLLDIGRTAKCVKGENLGAEVSYDYDYKGSRRLFVKNSKDHSQKIFTISDYHKNSKWVFPPLFVSFQEAMEALSEGKIVYFHGLDGEDEPVKVIGRYLRINLTGLSIYSLDSLYYGKWTVREG